MARLKEREWGVSPRLAGRKGRQLTGREEAVNCSWIVAPKHQPKEALQRLMTKLAKQNLAGIAQENWDWPTIPAQG